MKKRCGIITLLIIVMVMLQSCNQPALNPTPEDFGLSSDSLETAALKMMEFVDQGTYPFIATMVTVDGKIIDRRYFFPADMEKEPLSDSSIFRIFSMTKPIVAAGLMILHEEGLFSLDDPVATYIPEFKNTPVYTPEGLVPQDHPMTIRNLLTHTSGLTYGWAPNSYVDSLYRNLRTTNWEDLPLADAVRNLATVPLKHQPGTRYEYSLSIDVAGYLVELISGMPLDAFLQERLFEPLKMDDSGFYVPEEKKQRLAKIYYSGRDTSLSTPENPDEDRFLRKPILISGGGGMVSTMDDYARFATMLLNGGELDGVRVLEESTVELILSNQLPAEAAGWNGPGYGLGGAYNPETGEYGWGGAASTAFILLPGNNMAVLAFSQLMPSNYAFSEVYAASVKNAVMEK